MAVHKIRHMADGARIRRFRHHFSQQQSPKAERSQLLQHLRGNRKKVALRHSTVLHRLSELGAQTNYRRRIDFIDFSAAILNRTDQVLQKSNGPNRVRIITVRA
jgi:hypothetical protein